MLNELKTLCESCNLCRLGQEDHEVRGETLKPQVFSNMVKSPFVIVAQNPGYHELKKGEPLVGQAGKTLDTELARNGLDRNTFYITNILHCHTPRNRAPLPEELAACRPIITMELNYLKPKLVVALGKFAFNTFCPDEVYKDSLGTIKKSRVLGRTLNVFALYHPSGQNLALKERRQRFEEDVAKLAKLVKALQAEQANELPTVGV